MNPYKCLVAFTCNVFFLRYFINENKCFIYRTAYILNLMLQICSLSNFKKLLFHKCSNIQTTFFHTRMKHAHVLRISHLRQGLTIFFYLLFSPTNRIVEHSSMKWQSFWSGHAKKKRSELLVKSNKKRKERERPPPY